MNINANLIKDGHAKTIDKLIHDWQDRYESLVEKLAEQGRMARYWEGRFYVLRHENNQLRKANEKLRKQLNNNQPNEKGE